MTVLVASDLVDDDLVASDLTQGLRLGNAWMIALMAMLGMLVAPTPAKGAMPGVDLGLTPDAVSMELRLDQPSVALERTGDKETLGLELPESLEELQKMGELVGDLLSEIDPEVVQQVMQPLGREALRIFLDRAPGLSQQAIELGEQGLAELEKRALEGLEQAQEKFELNSEI